ncbi:2-C-methyl-D-erythritol 4-phosphate cytidylyltransferase [Allobranchiibius sp. CTAmp26]|uniref:2-C-methyl-D-erythritol 4-phosphate cytidylyltransferase n=1 Tax=Allobranchiibius sp. CTAmp26 TaxID=2815214 RepID=UPI001AA18FD7|nr:2-C-methyl-D-erythritol 4-phosphate cytidylyltransferase [Allobranchiibius sp. CTAmp26]MBO1753838.1 2-C-methyl-D-erythritol 4-phosphate cytidylyltransferase [Allobranchiibius sp. CTAmp26]
MTDAHPSSAEVGVVIVAAGLGTRLGAGMPKALVPLGGEPLVVHAARAARAVRGLRQLVVVAPATHLQQFRSLVPDAVVVAGGSERTDSVAAGLRVLEPGIDVVLVHDAARALAPTALFDRVVTAVREGYDAVVPGLAVHDTVKQVDGAGLVTATPERDELRAVQTPQGFTREALQRAHAGGAAATDDAAMVERSGGRVLVIEGDRRAEKITTAADLQNAASRLQPADGATLIVLGGLPGVGKTTTARALAARKALTHLRVDVIEQAVVDSGLEQHPVGEVGYRVSYELASHHLDLGMTVVADMVNGVPEARDAWRALADRRDVRLLEVELVCNDEAEHRRRASTRVRDIEGLPQPSWEQIQEREYHPWHPDLRIDTAANSPGQAADAILAALTSRGVQERIAP